MATYSMPTDIPRWADDLTNVLEPSEAKKNTGWQFEEVPPSAFENWKAQLNGQWWKWLNERLEDGLSADTLRITQPITLEGDNFGFGTFSSDPRIHFKGVGGDTYIRHDSSEDELEFYVGGVEQMRLTPTQAIINADIEIGDDLTVAGGLRVGFSGSPAADDRIELGDDEFYLDLGGSNPIVRFATTGGVDEMEYDRTGNNYIFRSGGNDQLTIGPSTINLHSNALSGATSIDGSGDLTMGTITMTGFSVDADGDVIGKTVRALNGPQLTSTGIVQAEAIAGATSIDGSGDLTMGTITMTGFSVDADGDVVAKSLSTGSGAIDCGSLDVSSGGITNAGSIGGATSIDGSGDLTMGTITMTGFSVDADGDTVAKSLSTGAGAIDCGSLDVSSGGITNAGSIGGATSIDGTGDLTMGTITMTGFTVDADGDVACKTVRATNGPQLTSTGISQAEVIAGATSIDGTGDLTMGTITMTGFTVDADGDVDCKTVRATNGPQLTATGISQAEVIAGASSIDGSGDLTMGTITMTGFTVDADGDTVAKSLSTGSGAIDCGSLDVSSGGITNAGSIGAGAITCSSLSSGSGAIDCGSLDVSSGGITNAGSIGAGAITCTSLSSGSGAIDCGSLDVSSGGITNAGAISGSASLGIDNNNRFSISAGTEIAAWSNSSIACKFTSAGTKVGHGLYVGSTGGTAVNDSIIADGYVQAADSLRTPSVTSDPTIVAGSWWTTYTQARHGYGAGLKENICRCRSRRTSTVSVTAIAGSGGILSYAELFNFSATEFTVGDTLRLVICGSYDNSPATAGGIGFAYSDNNGTTKVDLGGDAASSTNFGRFIFEFWGTYRGSDSMAMYWRSTWDDDNIILADEGNLPWTFGGSTKRFYITSQNVGVTYDLTAFVPVATAEWM